jgi:release factor glutamine methyltransferase
VSPERLQDWLVWATAELTAAGIEGAGGDARRLMEAALEIAPHQIALSSDRVLDAAEALRLRSFVADRQRHRPVSKIIGRRAFWRHGFLVTDDTLDPRPETEVLVAKALERPFLKMLDLGTGTGCILLSCLAERPAAFGTGTDLSKAALTVAAANATRLGIARAKFIESDWFSAVEGRFDLIVSNPPYIADDEMPGLSPDVRLWDPEAALTPGGDGLAAYRVIAAGAGARLIPGGRLLLEIGPTQAGAVSAYLTAQGFVDVAVTHDLDGRDRVVSAMKP